MSQETLEKDMNEHLELIPILDEDTNRTIVCIGWKTPVYDWDDLRERNENGTL